MLKNKILIIICVVSGLVFAFSCFMATSILTTAVKEKMTFDKLIHTVEQAETENTESTGTAQNPVLDSHGKTILPEYAALYNRNSDFFAWLKIEGTNINYPVMNTPKEPQYYLNRSFDKKKTNGGTPFLDSDCSKDGGIYIVYGHHMSNGTMFGTLPDYVNKEFWKQHKTIKFDTLYEHGEYEVIAAFLSRIYKPENKGFRYYEYTDLSSEVQFNSFIEQVKESELYETGVNAKYGDTLLVLSTCNYHTDDGRFVVVAKRNN